MKSKKPIGSQASDRADWRGAASKFRANLVFMRAEG
tara:strand:+ start:292 stop:399 length:108 start_codon:yes stop_codon:yes gene_type:complete